MALAADITRDAYTATAGQTTFPYTFPIAGASELEVYKNGQLLTLSTHYNVTGVGTPGGNVVLTTPAALGDLVVILGIVALAQGVTFTPNDPFPVASMNFALDHLMRATQQMQEQFGRVPLLHPGGGARNLRLAPPVGTNFLRYSADGQTIENTALTIPEFNTPLPNGFINGRDYGMRAEVGFDNAGAIAAAILGCPAGGTIIVPPGTYEYTGTIVLNKSVWFRGLNKRLSILQPMTPNVPAIRLAEGFIQVSDFFIQRTVKPVAGGDGIVVDNGMTHNRLDRLVVFKHYRGVVLRPTDLSYCVEVDVAACESHGWQFEYTDGGPIPGAVQWFLTRCGSNTNLGNGYYGNNTTTITGIGPWFTDCISFHNAGVGYQFVGESEHSLFDVFLNRCFASSDCLGGIDFLGTFGEAHMIQNCWVELVGVIGNIPQGFDDTLSVAPNAGVGLRVFGENRAGGININGGLVWSCSSAGVYIGTAGVHVTGVTCLDNGVALDSEFGNRAGLVVDANRVGVSGCTFTQSPGQPAQHLGIAIGEDVTTCDISPSNVYNGYGAIDTRVDTTFASLAGMTPILAPLGLAVATGRVGLQLFDETTDTVKVVRVTNGAIEVLNQAGDTVIFRLTDAGALSVSTIGVGNAAAATSLGSVAGKIEVFDQAGASLGFLPIYDAIT